MSENNRQEKDDDGRYQKVEQNHNSSSKSNDTNISSNKTPFLYSFYNYFTPRHRRVEQDRENSASSVAIQINGHDNCVDRPEKAKDLRQMINRFVSTASPGRRSHPIDMDNPLSPRNNWTSKRVRPVSRDSSGIAVGKKPNLYTFYDYIKRDNKNGVTTTNNSQNKTEETNTEKY